ncbi:hypothetical protein IA01_04540 [Flavobacterium psychrophilum]|uniref:VWA domain-containing protein n=8 Tax=Flavobacterium psychrophilum TaxID=96345 RepID=A6GY84_FLAPJ|nr:hypothetical protein [Flavobacterium psychrophilum]AIG29777.1 hypothetical protein IA03_04525 [Flavobacterium psychrophilum]AIG32054.1 hypothetical protein IA01_04540 [Flavobacterium psychrophilum]AIG34209.1 hypothetical protein IA02_03945 [Flavobacterium psychrophilum]AIG36572.1 hypothetical protein IA04_04440 [Flavobacterium psychrophilum]AIG38837.1 hypothetical protein IA05_04525 [Flavobacterium psychrophilum]
MNTNTILLIILSLVTAGGLSFYQYFYKNKNYNKVNFLLALLRFISIFSIILLLINPVISRKTYETSKTPLPIIVDNSQSISELKQEKISKELSQKLLENTQLNDKYDVQLFSFDNDFYTNKPIDYKGKQTNIHKVAQNMKQLYRNQNFPIVLLSDGNQTIGNDYVYSFPQNNQLYPLVLGDTTSFLDIKINQLNVNKYAFLKNKFPVEVFLQYNGDKSINTTFSIQEGNHTIHKQIISFSANKKSQEISVLLNANKVGVHSYKASITTSEIEKNKYNNTKNFAVEIIDQRSEIALISAINHPDLGAIKRAIETNVQHKVTLVKPQQIKSLNSYNVLILYQPNIQFKPILEQNKNLQLNTFVITGLSTDYNILNEYQDQLKFRMSNQNENFTAQFNPEFNLFALDNIGFEQFPPLENSFGNINITGNVNTLLQSQIRNINTKNPLLAFAESGIKRNAYLFGENIWKWRLESHVKTKSFEQFDIFIDKIIQFLASNVSKKSLIVTHESFYNSGENIEVSAQFFNKNYEFEENAKLTIQLKNNKTKTTKVYDFLKGNGEYKVNLDGLEAGNYSFTVKENNSKASYSNKFEVLYFEIEKQFVNPDISRLTQLARNTNSKIFYPNQVDKLITELLKKESFPAIQKEIVKKSALIESIWLLILLAITLATEWFIRKYNGML